MIEKLSLQSNDGTELITLVETTGPNALAARGSEIDSEKFGRLCEIIGKAALEISGNLVATKEHTKSVEVEIAFELSGGFNLKIVDASSKSSIKLRITI